MKNKNLQGGFAPLLIIAIVAILAIGGGTYVATKNKQAKNVELEDNLDTQANAKADENANVNANLGVNANAKSSLRSLFGLGRSTKCTFTNTTADVSSSGTIYLGANGDMHGEFESKVGTQDAISSHMIVKNGVSFVWSGTQGMKMSATSTADASAEAQTKQYVDLDAQMDYDCSAWTRDESKFTVPTGVNFVDFDALLKAGVKIPGAGN
jgi:hypothetical protein